MSPTIPACRHPRGRFRNGGEAQRCEGAQAPWAVQYCPCEVHRHNARRPV